MKVLLFLLLITLVTTSLANVDYSGWRLCSVIIGSDSDKVILESFQDNTHYIFWKNMHNEDNTADVLIHPAEIKHFQTAFKDSQVTTKIEDIQNEIANENPTISSTSSSDEMSWKQYNSYETVIKWLDNLATEFKGIVTILDIGESHEKRIIKGVRVSFNKNNAKKGIYLEGGVHGREWITVATVTYQLNEILRSTDPIVRKMAESHDWYIFPIVNPDGYSYSFTTDRMWKKTRKPTERGCFGVDLNRNWNETAMETTDNPCNDGYPGRAPISEPETKALNKFYEKNAANFLVYISFHSYSQFLLIPYGESDVKPDNFDELYNVAEKMAEAIKEKHSSEYTYGNIEEMLYSALGTNVDFVKRNYGTRITYFWELRDKSQHGLTVPATDIIATGEETKTGIIIMLNQFKN